MLGASGTMGVEGAEPHGHQLEKALSERHAMSQAPLLSQHSGPRHERLAQSWVHVHRLAHLKHHLEVPDHLHCH